MGVFELIDIAKKKKTAKWKAVFSSSTYSSPTSISGQLGYYGTIEEAVDSMATRLPEIGGLFGEYLGSAVLYKKVNGKWKKHGEYALTPQGKLFRRE